MIKRMLLAGMFASSIVVGTGPARSQLRQDEFLFSQMKDNVRPSPLGVERALTRIDVARAAMEQAEENSRSTNEKYRNGPVTSTDLPDASVAVLQREPTTPVLRLSIKACLRD